MADVEAENGAMRHLERRKARKVIPNAFSTSRTTPLAAMRLCGQVLSLCAESMLIRCALFNDVDVWLVKVLRIAVYAC